MTPAIAVLVLLAVLLVVFPAAVLAIWVAGGRLLGRDRGPNDSALDENGSAFADLDTSGFATAAQIATLTPSERLFVSRALGHRLSGVTRREPVSREPAPREPAPRDRAAGSASAAARLTTDREVPVAAFILVCPACGSSLGTAADVAHYVGSCPSCSRRVTSRRRGSRIGLE